MKKEKIKNILIGIGVIFLYFFCSFFPDIPLKLLKIDFITLNKTIKNIYLIVYELLLAFIIIYIYRKDFIPNFLEFKKNIKSYYKKYIKYWFLALELMIVSNIIVTLFTTTEVANNQTSIIELLKEYPIYTFIITVITAPIIEESVFRFSIRKIISKSNILYILVSGLLFGSLHVIGTINNLVDLLFIIPYSIPGIVFAYCLVKSKNIFVPIGLHFIHNSIMMLLQILLLFI